MSTIIDSLIVELGLDAKNFSSSQQTAVGKLKELEKAGEKTEKSVKDTSKSFGDLTRSLGSFLAVIGGTVAIKHFISDFIESNAALERLSKNLGLSVSTISAWSNTTEKLGGSSQALQGTLDMLSKSQTQLMLTGESSLIPYMSALGISLADVQGKARPVTDILLDLSDRFSHMDRTTANNLGRMMGLDQGTLNILLQGRKELELEISRQKEQTAVTKEQATQAQKFQTQIIGIKQQFQALGRTLFMEAAPYLEKVFKVLATFVGWMKEHEQFVADFLKVMAVGLAAIALAAAPIDLTVVAVLALAAGIALLWDDYQTWAKGGNSAFDWGNFVVGVNKAKDAFEFLANGIKEAYQWWSKWMNRGHENDKNWIGIPTNSRAGSTIDPITKQRIGGKPQSLTQPAISTIGSGAIIDYFVKRGWTPAQAAGIAANVKAESSGNSKATGDNGSAYGLAQWHSDRQAAFKAKFGHDIRDSTLEEQLAFIQHELTKGSERSAGNSLRGATDARQAGEILSRKYERPADASGEAARRGEYASTLSGVPGAASIVTNAAGASGARTTNIDRSVQTQISQLTVNTQATDAQGLARDLEHSFDYLFASQANYGLVP